jgi:hypothetical protein
MKFLVYLMTLLFSTAVAQNPTILQGNYVSNVFGNSNFVLNPNAQTNVANVTTVTATVARSTTTPLVATSEFTVAIGTANGTATWATRAFDAGMKGQNCEARFSYRGFAATSIVQIKQSTNVVASLTLTPATDPRIASINFPCGDLSAATTFVVTDTAILAGTNEIGGIYVGLATNMANVAQAEFVGSIQWAVTANCIWTSTNTAYSNFAADADCDDNARTVNGNLTDVSVGQRPAFSATLKPGRYQVIIQGSIQVVNNAAQTDAQSEWRLFDGTSQFGPSQSISAKGTASGVGGIFVPTMVFDFDVATTTSGTFDFQSKPTGATLGTTRVDVRETNLKISVYRFPSSSELVVTPERQNTFGGVKFTGGNSTLFNTVAASTTYANYIDATNWKPTSAGGTGTYYGKATTTTTTGELGIKIPSMPVGTYRMTLRGNVFPDASAGASGQYAACTVELYETTTTSAFGKNYQFTGHGAAATVPGPGDFAGQLLMDGVFANTSVADRNFIVRAQKLFDSTTGNVGKCSAVTFNSDITITLSPLDQQSNSALYVQGPVKAAATGAAIPAGYVGEVKHSATIPGCGTAGQYNDGASVSLTPGIWQVTSQAVLGLTTTSTVTNWIVFTGPTTGNSSTWRVGDLNDYSIAGVSVASVPGITQPLLVKYDGTNLFYFANGSYTGSTASASGTIYAKYFRNHSGTCGALNSSITAIRLN